MATANASPKQFAARRVGGADEGESTRAKTHLVCLVKYSPLLILKLHFPSSRRNSMSERGHRPLPESAFFYELKIWLRSINRRSSRPPSPLSHGITSQLHPTRGEISVVNFPDRMHFCFTTPKCRAHRSNDVLFISMAIKCSVHVIWHYVNGLVVMFQRNSFFLYAGKWTWRAMLAWLLWKNSAAGEKCSPNKEAKRVPAARAAIAFADKEK